MLQEQVSPLPLDDGFPVQVQISIFPNGDDYTAYISVERGMFHRFHIGLKAHDIKALNLGLQKAIKQVASNLEANGIYDEEILQLAQKGNFAFKRIFAEGTPRETIRTALKEGATIQVVTWDFILPWELLYDGPLDKQVDVSSFWGMRYIVSRALIQDARPGDIASPIIHSSCPCVGIIACRELEHVSKKEIPALRKLHRSKSICLSSLRSQYGNQRDKALQAVGRFMGKKLHILHFACHAYEKEPISQSYLLISDNFDITMEDFGIREFAIKHNPFVILNACLTGTINPLYTSNWAALFWGRGARGVLATELDVPDWFAAAFIEEVYRDFLSGKPIGETLLTARRSFWEKQCNLLGLAYALYSSPSIRIAN